MFVLLWINRFVRRFIYLFDNVSVYWIYVLLPEILLQFLGDVNSILRGIIAVLHDTGQSPLNSSEGAIEHMNKLHLPTIPIHNISNPRLIVSTIGNRHKFPIFLLRGIPPLEIKFPYSRIIKLS